MPITNNANMPGYGFDLPGVSWATRPMTASVQNGSGLAGPSPLANALAGAGTGAAVGSVVPGIGTAIGAGIGALGGLVQTGAEMIGAKKQRDWNEAMMDKQNQWSLEMWNRTNEYNSPSAQVARLRQAGLNPLYYGLDGTSANAFESAGVLGYDRANFAGMTNPLQVGFENAMASRSLQKDIDLKNAQIDKIKADTQSVGLDNRWKDLTMDARVESERLQNSLTKEQIDTYKKQRAVWDKDIALKIEQAKSEVERQALIQAQKIVADNQAQEIVTLLPYKKLLLEAQEANERADAALKWTMKAKEQKLINDGYYDAMIEKEEFLRDAAKIGVDKAKAEQVLLEFKARVRNGTLAQEDLREYCKSKGIEPSKADEIIALCTDKIFQFTSVCAEAVGGSLAGIVAGGLAGKAVGSAASKNGKYKNPLDNTYYPSAGANW